jgi:hypothetical protein
MEEEILFVKCNQGRKPEENLFLQEYSKQKKTPGNLGTVGNFLSGKFPPATWETETSLTGNFPGISGKLSGKIFICFIT